MALLTTQVVGGGPPGVKTITFAAAAAGGDTFTAGPDVFLWAKKGAGSDVTVTAAVPGSPGEGITEASGAVTVPQGSDAVWGPFPAVLFGGTVTITYSAVTTLTIAVIKFVSA